MKTELRERSIRPEDRPFPKLMVNSNNGDGPKRIILATAYDKAANNFTGTLVHTHDDRYYKVGHHSTTWGAYFFTDYLGEVILSGED